MTERATGAEEVLWDLSDLYESPDDPRFEKEVNEALLSAERFREQHHGKVAGLDPAALAEAVAELERIYSTLARAGIFAYLRFSTDTADPTRGALVQRTQELQAKLKTELLFFELEWIALGDDRAARLLADPALDKYRHFLEAQRRYKPYRLSEPEEKILAEKNVSAAQAWSRLFTELTAALRVKIGDEEVPMERALSRLQQADRDVRRTAAEAITEALSPGLRTRSFIFNTLLLDKSTDDRLRSYPTWISSRNLANEASDESVEALVDAVVARYDIPQRYYALKARLLGLDRLADYDRLAPITSEATSVTWAEASELVAGAYEAFSPVAGGIIRGFFDRNWIDAAAVPDKMPGAYCMTTVPGVHPYVLMSFTGERRSVLTLAHELGHGLHGSLAQDRGLFNASTPLTLAETASVFGEALTFRKLLAGEQEAKKRLDLLVGRLDDAVTTVFRQVAMNRFEDAVHNARRADGELSLDRLAEIWADTQRVMLGEAVEMTDGYRSWWSYVSHFIGLPGYVYAYAFGYLFSLAIFRRYEQEGESMVDPYLDLLRAGGSDTPERLGKIVGLDLADPGFWAGGLEAIDGVLGEAEGLAAQIG